MLYYLLSSNAKKSSRTKSQEVIPTQYRLFHSWHERIAHGQCETKQLFSFINRSTNVSSKFETIDALKQNTENASEELSLAYQFPNIKVFFGLFLFSPLIFNQNSSK